MAAHSPLEQLANELSSATKIVADYLRTSGHVQPSFDREAPSNVLPPDAPLEIKNARTQILDASLKIQQLAQGPAEFLPNLQVGVQHLTAVRWMLHFKALQAIPHDEPISYRRLSILTHVPESQLKSISRMAMTAGLFCEPYPNCIAHTATSYHLATNEAFQDWALWMAETTAPTAFKHVEATEKWGDTKEKHQTAYALAMGIDIPFFDHLKLDANRTKQFANYMKTVTSVEGTDIKHLVAGFPWASLPKNATIVDVGGSTGHASKALAKAHKHLKFVVQDLGEVVDNVDQTLADCPEHVKGRITYRTHNFFEEQPIKGADVYLLRMIIHDWPEEQAILILKNLVPAMKNRSRMIIADTVLPRPGRIPLSKERLLRVRDLTMLQVFNSLERSEEDWKELLAKVDTRLKLRAVREPFGSVMGILEVVFEEEYEGYGDR
ncbi:putative O-methyltransferase [Ascobolus immersus RN42]|uniref:Putative O-methyltransferase n=1 Tax=Ascobolus immersus RN42 TaxID=1160509 RepID=A0A3N4IU69_ASCIM|nr:putative O-methyltransferase [Ascobolus immersus RN42]